MAFGYLYFVCSVGLLLGVKLCAIPLMLAHLVHSIVFDNPWQTISQNDYDTKLRALMFDACLLATLFMIMGTKIYTKQRGANHQDKKIQ